MADFKVGDRIAVYGIDHDKLIGKVTAISYNILCVKLDKAICNNEFQMFHKKQCRKLIKKKKFNDPLSKEEKPMTFDPSKPVQTLDGRKARILCVDHLSHPLAKWRTTKNDDCISGEESAYKIGKSYFIRMATYHVTGELVAMYQHELVLKNAAWIADSGRFYDALKKGEFSEVEPFINDVIVNRDSIIDATEWNHKLPRDQK